MMSSTTLKIFAVDEKSPHLEEVISLGRANAAMIGFLPTGAFKKYASDNQILIALGEHKDVLGYLVYAASHRKALVYIVHLCVKEANRRQGIAKALFGELRNLTKNEFRGIRVRCRRDYEASKLWPKLGFTAASEMPGRSKRSTILTTWWFDFGHPTLFTYGEERQLQSKLKVVIDANVFFQLQDTLDTSNEESRALLADWLHENVELCLTNETFNEIDRHHDAGVRKQGRAFASGFTTIACKEEEFLKVQNILRSLFPDHLSESDESDLRQLARSIASGVQFFVTRDTDLLAMDDLVYNTFNLRIIRPVDLIVNQDQLMREFEYHPARLAGSQIKIERVHSNQSTSLEDVFRAPQKETKAKFRRRLHSYLSDPRTYETDLVQSAGLPLALIVYGRQTEKEMEIPVFRMIQESLAATLARYLALNFISTASRENRVLVRVSDSYIPNIIIDALQEVGFVISNNIWLKACVSAVETSKELASRLTSLSIDFPLVSQYFEQLANTLTTSRSLSDNLALLRVERSLWPAKVTDMEIPAFIVPIGPIWAMHLFDPGIANQDLFGGEPSLIFNVENVYYRAYKPRVLSAPARVLWYVSKGKYQGTMSIRACSYIDEVVVDCPKPLYSRFRRLGVYQWDDVFNIAKRNTSERIMAFRFSNTEVFNHPISRNELQNTWLRETGKNFHIQAPISISHDRFLFLYKKGMGQI